MRWFMLVLSALVAGGQAAPIQIPPDPLILLGTLSQDNKSIAVLHGKYSSHIRMVDTQTGEQKHETWLPAEALLTIRPALSGDGQKIAFVLGPDDKGNTRVAVVSAKNPTLENAVILTGGLQQTILLALNHDGSRLATGNQNGYAQLWDVSKATRLTTILSDTKREPAHLLFGKEDNTDVFAAIFKGQTRTRIFHAQTGELLITLSGVGTGAFSPTNTGFLATRGRFISLKDGKELPQPPYLKETSGVIDHTADGTQILVRRNDLDSQGREWLELREVASGKILGTLTRIPDGNPEFLSADGLALLTGDGQGGIRILPLTTP